MKSMPTDDPPLFGQGTRIEKEGRGRSRGGRRGKQGTRRSFLFPISLSLFKEVNGEKKKRRGKKEVQQV